VQVFEMEVSHKKDPATWVSMVTEHFRTNVNGGPWANATNLRVHRVAWSVWLMLLGGRRRGCRTGSGSVC